MNANKTNHSGIKMNEFITDPTNATPMKNLQLTNRKMSEMKVSQQREPIMRPRKDHRLAKNFGSHVALLAKMRVRMMESMTHSNASIQRTNPLTAK
mmetsp:Transcript_1242/g.1603  ORF Transcript_1242/g.1603 Transcript_1242/m.1603 type:complete len:96 (+) Transcript_1242:306-593(+)